MASLSSMLRKRYAQFFVFSRFLTRGFSKNLPFQSYGIIYLLPYGDSYCAIATTHGFCFHGISLAGCLEAS